ncbi:MAG: glycine--tRNA ligase subunit beta [Candidatus Bipolaricaulia bacterium]
MNDPGRALLVEIGTEEIPSGLLAGIAAQLRTDAERLLRETGIGWTAIEVLHTPRRLVLSAQDVAGDRIQETLPGIVAELVRAIRTEKRMRWEASDLEFIRPIRWLVCLFGDEVVPVELGSLRAGRATRNRRFCEPEWIEARDPTDYFDRLGTAVILDPKARRATIEAALEQTAEEIGGRPVQDEALLEELVASFEYPSPVPGEFPEHFLRLPQEVVIATLIQEERFVPFVSDQGMKPYFLGFRDGEVDDGTVKRGYEQALRAQLADSQFSFAKDRETTLAEKTEELKAVIYQERLGSIWDKVGRIRRYAHEIAHRLDFPTMEVDRAAFLCKADLMTEIVKKFPGLKGMMGSVYASLDGESERVANGIREHYLPRAAGDPIPQTEIGIALSLADKLDTIVGSIVLVDSLSGSRDPFDLNHKADGVIRIAIERNLDLDFYRLIRDLEEQFARLREGHESGIEIEVIEAFFQDRVYQVLVQEYRVDDDLGKALTAAPTGNFLRTFRKAKALERSKDQEAFKALVAACSRMRHVTEDHEIEGYDSALFEEEAELELWRRFLEVKREIINLESNRDYNAILQALTRLKEPIDRYFNAVRVMTDDRVLRENRLGFLLEVEALFFTIGDLSKIVVE